MSIQDRVLELKPGIVAVLIANEIVRVEGPKGLWTDVVRAEYL